MVCGALQTLRAGTVAGTVLIPGHHNELCAFLSEDVLQHALHALLALILWSVRLADAHKLDAKGLSHPLQVWMVGHHHIDLTSELACRHNLDCCNNQSQGALH